MEEAIEKITNDELSINAASLQYKIPYGTLYNKYKGLHGKTPGGQPVFTHQEELAILRAAATCGDWGFPLTLFDLRMFAKAHLDRQGKIIERFSNNLPGVEWAISVLKRHKHSYGQRLSTNIKRSRATVGRESLNKYFDNLYSEIENVPPSNIFNYDESNMADDPGKKKCVYRRGVKYPEKVMNYSKSSTTVMICGSADGTLLPPYIIYKSTHLYDTWQERGIVGKPCCEKPCCSRGCRYNRTTSGWIDTPTFRDWFMNCFLPHAKRLDGKKVLIGDNLSSHIDNDVLVACEINNISFICLVPNSTHLTQPLDVGFFRPLKIAWRQTLEDWKKANLRTISIPKESFPHLLKKTIINMDQKPPKNDKEACTELSAVKRNLVSSFRATGISPFDRNRVLNKLPPESPSPEIETGVRDSLTEFLREQRFRNESQPRRKRTRLQIEPGKSISTLNETSCPTNQEVDVVEVQHTSERNDNRVQTESISMQIPLSVISEPSTSYRTGYKDTNDNITDCESDNENIAPNYTRNTSTDLAQNPAIGQFILAKFGSQKGKKTYHYVCSIEDIIDTKLVVQGYKSQKKTKTIFKEVPKDLSIIEISDIITYLPKPKYINECYSFPNDVMIKEL
ncbi:unnamed protein product [Parnassius mnemosyne]